jgi:hypothetical protein
MDADTARMILDAQEQIVQDEAARKVRIVKVIKDALVGVQLSLIGAWGLMIVVGVIHHEWLPTLPTLGWWDSVLISVLGDLVLNCWAWGARVKVLK